MLFQQQSSTHLHAVTRNLGKLNAGAKLRASHYRACFALSACTANYLFIKLVICCSVPLYYTVRIIRSITLFCMNEQG